MNARSNPTRPSDAEWELHKDTIYSLYMLQNYTLEKVMNALKRSPYNFFATKAQFEGRFKRWGMKKNLSSDQWKKIALEVKRREDRGVGSAVYQQGRRVPQKRVEKETKRYNPPTLLLQQPGLIMPQCFSEEIIVRTPSPTVTTISTWTRELPFRLFEDSVCNYPSFEVLFGFSRYSTRSTIIANPQSTPEAMQLRQQATNSYYSNVLPRTKALFSLSMLGHDVVNIAPNSSFDQVIADDVLNSAYSRLLIFSISNNFAGLDGLPLKLIWGYLKPKMSMDILGLLGSVPARTSDALAEKIFQCAIEAMDHDAVDTLISNRHKRIDPNKIVWYIDGRCYTPIKRSVELGDIATIKVLIRHNVDIYRFGEGYNDSVLEFTLRYSKDLPISTAVELTESLLNAGANPDMSCFEVVITHRDSQLFRVLFDFDRDRSCTLLMSNRLLRNALTFLDERTATHVLKHLLETDFGQRIQGSSGSALLNDVASRGFLEIFELLYSRGAALTSDTLCYACDGGNVDLVKFILDTRVDVCYIATSSDQLLLFKAIKSENDELFDLIMDRAKLNPQFQENIHSESLLLEALETGRLDLVEGILQYARDINAHILQGCLQEAAHIGNTELCIKLIEAGALPHFSYVGEKDFIWLRRNQKFLEALFDAEPDVDSDGITLALALEWDDLAVIEGLISAGANVCRFDFIENFEIYDSPESPLISAITKRNTPLIDLLIRAGADLKEHSYKDGSTALVAAVTTEDIDLIRHILSAHAGLLEPGDLITASLHTRGEIFNLLLESSMRLYHDHRPFSTSPRPLHTAIRHGIVDIIKFLLENNVNSSALVWDADRAENALAVAIEENQDSEMAILKTILESVTDLNMIVSLELRAQALTPLLLAIKITQIPVIRLLLKEKASVNLPATWGIKRTPLQMAAEKGNIEIIQLLLSEGAEVNAVPAQRGGGTALQLAAIGGYCGVLDLLISHKADVNAAPARFHGRTALEGAAEHGRLDAVQLLRNAGARIDGNYRQYYEYAMKLAERNGHFAVLDLLKSFASSTDENSLGSTYV